LHGPVRDSQFKSRCNERGDAKVGISAVYIYAQNGWPEVTHSGVGSDSEALLTFPGGDADACKSYLKHYLSRKRREFASADECFVIHCICIASCVATLYLVVVGRMFQQWIWRWGQF